MTAEVSWALGRLPGDRSVEPGDVLYKHNVRTGSRYWLVLDVKRNRVRDRVLLRELDPVTEATAAILAARDQGGGAYNVVRE